MSEIDSWAKMLEEVSITKPDLIWVGETHGIANNYAVYKKLITKLSEDGFRTVALEYPEELEHFSVDKFMNYSHYEDGRFGQESLDFFQWLVSAGQRIVCFDVRRQEMSQQEGEGAMAENLLSKLSKGEKILVISGSFHGRKKLVNGVIPQAGLIEQRGLKILCVGMNYTGGQFYNFGVKRIRPNSNLLADVNYWLHGGVAKQITLLRK